MWFAIVVLTAFLAIAEGDTIMHGVTDLTNRGKRLTDSHLDSDGVVMEDPENLCAAASRTLGRPITLDAYALARMCRSEDGSASDITKIRLCNVAINQARKLGWTTARVITFHSDPRRDKRFGKQITGRFASTRDPYENDLYAAEQAIGMGDFTGGAINFVHRNAFGVQAGTSTFASFVDTMKKEGKRGGVFADSGANLVFFWRGDLPDDVTPIDELVA